MNKNSKYQEINFWVEDSGLVKTEIYGDRTPAFWSSLCNLAVYIWCVSYFFSIPISESPISLPSLPFPPLNWILKTLISLLFWTQNIWYYSKSRSERLFYSAFSSSCSTSFQAELEVSQLSPAVVWSCNLLLLASNSSKSDWFITQGTVAIPIFFFCS